MRDVSHSHQHHAPSTDTMLTCQKQDNEDVEWKRHIIYSLQHSVVESRRSGGVESLIHAKGVLAYRDSFIAISGISSDSLFVGSGDKGTVEEQNKVTLEEQKAKQEATTKRLSIPKADFLLRSIDAQIEFSQHKNLNQSEKLSVNQIFLVVVALFFAIVTLLFQGNIDKPSLQDSEGVEFINWIARIVANYFYAFVGCYFVFMHFFLVSRRTSARVLFQSSPSRSQYFFRNSIDVLKDLIIYFHSYSSEHVKLNLLIKKYFISKIDLITYCLHAISGALALIAIEIFLTFFYGFSLIIDRIL